MLGIGLQVRTGDVFFNGEGMGGERRGWLPVEQEVVVERICPLVMNQRLLLEREKSAAL